MEGQAELSKPSSPFVSMKNTGELRYVPSTNLGSTSGIFGVHSFPTKPELRGEDAQFWCTNLETGVDQRPEAPGEVEAEETKRIVSASRSGRVWWHQHQHVPPACRAAKPKEEDVEEPLTEEEEQQLIYLSLFRDKVDKHHASKASPSTTAGGFALTAPEPLARGGRSSVDADAKPSMDVLGGLKTAGSPPKASTQRLGTTVHTAAVGTKSSQGTVAEHFETKRLWKLFEEWQASQGSQGSESLGMPSPRSEGRGARRRREALEVLVEGSSPHGASAARAGASSSKEPSSFGISHSTPRAVGSQQAEVNDEMSVDRVPTDKSRRSAHERRKMERVYTVLTNSKVRMASLGEQKLSHERDRHPPTHIEGIPPLMLYKLHQGPWRLDF
eukprot:TRINITY_DN22587_c0_g1_i2.p1 TRINITY_DN22587_c0_g1~~TRINITY_DN22587_c0_g1_i2.p1  ORF type:complete len:386 (-),score=88.01 TRINITY_DN22587_c0_g1_i2:51-1208(-)